MPAAQNNRTIVCQLSLPRGAFRLQVDLTLPGRGVTILFGRSGCGKTSLLRAMAGLEPQASGRFQVLGQEWAALAVHQRPLGFVFQEASLLPHLNVGQNLNFGYRRIPEDARVIGFTEVVDLLGLAPFLNRLPQDLSGGQRQRVAIGCALLTSPRLLLMDEPLSALDDASKAEIMPYLAALKERLELPVFYVTHCTEEALRLGDHLVVLDQGQVMAQGPLPELIRSGTIPGLASDGLLNLLLAEPVPGASELPGLQPVQLAGQTLWLTDQQLQQYRLQPGQKLRLQIPAKGLLISRDCRPDASVLNQLQARLLAVSPEPDGEFCRLQLALSADASGPVLLALIPQAQVAQLKLSPGLALRVLISQLRLLG